MEDQNPVFQTTDYLKKYINIKVDIILLNIGSKMGTASAYLVFAVVMGFIALFISLFLSLSLADWLANVLNMPGIGNLIVSLIYLILAIILITYKEKLIINPIKKTMSSAMDFSDLHNESSIRKDESVDEAINHLNTELINTEVAINENVDDIRNYYSFEQLKDRFLESIYQNPKSILNTLLILREIIKSRKKK